MLATVAGGAAVVPRAEGGAGRHRQQRAGRLTAPTAAPAAARAPGVRAARAPRAPGRAAAAARFRLPVRRRSVPGSSSSFRRVWNARGAAEPGLAVADDSCHVYVCTRLNVAELGSWLGYRERPEFELYKF